MDAFASSSSTSNDHPMSGGTSATGRAASVPPSSPSRQSSGALPSRNYNNYHINCNYHSYNHVPPRYPSHGEFMMQQQLPTPPRPYYNYYNVPTRPPPPPYTPYFPLYPSPHNSNYFNPQTLPFAYRPPPPPSPPSPPLLPLMRQDIAKQIDFYFCDDNLATDEFLREHMDEEGWVPIALVADFRRVAQITKDIKFVLESLEKLSCNVEVQGDKIRRRGNWKKWLPKRRRT